MQRRLDIDRRRRDVREHRFVERRHVGGRLAEIGGRPTLQRRRVDDREVELRVGRAQFVEEFEGTVDDPVRTRAGTVDFVDHHDRPEPERQGFARHEAGLGHRAFDRVHQQQHAIDHRQHALDLAAEVGMARGVDDVDAGAAVIDGAVLGEDGDAALALQVVRVHHALADALVSGEGAGLLEQAVDQRGLAVVDVRDDRDVADGAGGAHGGDVRAERARGGRRGAGKKVAQRTRARPFPATWSATCSAVGTLGSARPTGGVQGGVITGILRPRAMPVPDRSRVFQEDPP